MTSATRWVGPVVQCTLVGVLVATTACVMSNPPTIDSIHPSYKELLKEATQEYTYVDAGDAVPGNAAAIGKYGAVTGVTMKAYSVKKNAHTPTRSREVVARFDLTGGDYPRLGMHEGVNYVFVEHTNEHGPGAIVTRAYYVVPEKSTEIRYLVVDKRVDLLPGHRYAGPVAIAADPQQAFVFGGCVEGSFCPSGHCSVTDAGDRY